MSRLTQGTEGLWWLSKKSSPSLRLNVYPYDMTSSPHIPAKGTLAKLPLQDQSELRHLTMVYCHAPLRYRHCHCLRLRVYESCRLILLALGIPSTVPHWAT